MFVTIGLCCHTASVAFVQQMRIASSRILAQPAPAAQPQGATNPTVHKSYFGIRSLIHHQGVQQMKTLKLALISFAVGATLSTGSLAAYACASTIYVQDQSDCHFYSRYV